MSDSEINEEDDLFDQDDVEIKDENAESDIVEEEEEEEQKETIIEEQPQIAIERVDKKHSSIY